MTYQERAAALADKINNARDLRFELFVTDESREDINAEYYWSMIDDDGLDLIVTALSFLAEQSAPSPAPADLRGVLASAVAMRRSRYEGAGMMNGCLPFSKFEDEYVKAIQGAWPEYSRDQAITDLNSYIFDRIQYGDKRYSWDADAAKQLAKEFVVDFGEETT